MKKVDYTLYFITNSDGYDEETFLRKVKGACMGGATIIQLREKNKSTLEYYELALKVKNITDAYNIPLIIDDRIDVAMAVGCGVHLGNEDMPISQARKIMGEDCIIGATAKTVEVAKKAEADGADYLGCGAIYPTKTHVKTKITSVETLNKDNLSVLEKSPIQGVCVVSAIMDAEDTKKAAEELKKSIQKIVA